MIKIGLLIITLIVLLTLTAHCALPDISPGGGLQVGARAPDFTLTNLKGETVSLRALKGKVVLLNFWTTWCPPCRAEAPYFQQFFEENKEVVLLKINIRESRETIMEYMRKHGYTFPVLLDSDGKVAKDYQVRGIPATFLIDKNGVIKATRVGAFGSKAEIEDLLKKL